MAMDLSAIKSKLTSLQNQKSGGQKRDMSLILWKPTVGKHSVRIVPAMWDRSNPFKEMLVHYGIGNRTMISLVNFGEKDPIVEFAKSLRTTQEKENWQLAKKLDPKMRVFAPIVVRGEEEKGVRLWEFGKEIYMQLLGIAEDEDYGDFTDISEGRDFTVDVVTGDIGGRQGLKSSICVKPKTSPLGSDKETIKMWLTEQPNVLELQRKTAFDDLKTILANFLNPEVEETVAVEVDEDEDPIIAKAQEEPKTNYSLKAAPVAKVSKADKFDALFDDEEEGEGSPF